MPPSRTGATLDGAVHFMYPGEHVGQFVRAFDRIEAITESDALMETKVSVLSRIEEASWHTESWWEGDGFRVHLSRTMAKVFEQSSIAKWAVWARDETAVEKAWAFAKGQ
jgi:hypothetical protein